MTQKTISGLETLLDPEKKINALSGHLDIKPLLEHSASVPLLTILRDPYKHMLSFYSFIKEKPDNHFHEFINKNNITLKQALKEGTIHLLDNFQVRCLSGNMASQFGSITQAELEQACYNLDHHIRYFGFTEKFSEFVAIMQLTLGWKFMFYRNENITKNKSLLPDPELEELITHHTRFDRVLYAYAQKRYEEQNQQFGDKLKKKVQRLEFWNRRYQTASDIKRKLIG